ncbi:MAG TPA: hypothetical protein VL422_17545, partial [Miltoncostaea sp.]|nr:hypothetical protein [Miltoncostaea sp.]
MLATLMLLAAGVALRLVEYTSGRALWLDESLLWLNLRGLSFRELTGPLDLGQGAPIPFLLVEKSALEVLGDAEWALRLPSLVAGIALLPVVALLAARLLTPGRAWVALAPVALGVPAIAYSSQVKQYGIDALVAGLLLLVLLPAARAPLTRGRAAGLALAGAAAVWCSDPAVFVLAGGGAALLISAAVARDRSRLTALGWVVAAWLASFAVLYVVHVRDLAVVRGLATSDSSGGS